MTSSFRILDSRGCIDFLCSVIIPVIGTSIHHRSHLSEVTLCCRQTYQAPIRSPFKNLNRLIDQVAAIRDSRRSCLCRTGRRLCGLVFVNPGDGMANESDREFGFHTRSIHAGSRPDPTTGARALPIYQTTSYVFEDPESAAAYFDLREYGNTYSRIMNPTVAAF